MAEFFDTTRGDGTWNPRFVWPFNDWELDAFQNFICMINSKTNQPVGEGQITLEGGQKWHVLKANFAFLEGRNLRSVPMKMIWNSCVLPKVSLFAWEVGWGWSNSKKGFSDG